MRASLRNGRAELPKPASEITSYRSEFYNARTQNRVAEKERVDNLIERLVDPMASLQREPRE